jgi:hypothetical protein
MSVNSSVGKTSYYITNPLNGVESEVWSGYGEVGKEINYQFASSASKAGDVMTVTITYMISAQIPFPTKNVPLLEDLNPGPPINVSGTFTFVKNMSTGQVDFSESHNLDGFPASEYFLKNVDNGLQIPTLLFTPDDVSDVANLLPLIGDRTLKTFGDKTIVAPNGNLTETWGGATSKTENGTTPYCVPAGDCVDEFSID